MKPNTHHHYYQRAFSLIEATISIGVLAVACPLVFAAIAQAGKSTLSSEAESRSTWIVPKCMEEIRASRAGNPQYFTTSVKGDAFPPPGDVWVLGFSPDGKVTGKISKAEYERGMRKKHENPILYLASMSAAAAKNIAGDPPLMNVRISVSYPATLPLARRDRLDFYTLIP